MEKLDDLFKKLEQEAIEYEAKRAPYVKALVEKLNISKEEVSELRFDIEKIPYNPIEFASVVEYFIKIFNGFDKLCSFIKEQSVIDTIYDVSIRKNTIFTMKPYIQFGERIIFLQKFFEVDRDECVLLITKNPSWIYHKEQYFIDRLESFTNFFNITKSKAVSLFKEYPFTLGKRIKDLSTKIDEIAKYFDVNTAKVKELLLDYPGLMNRSLGYFLEYKITKEIFDKHWLIRCITAQNDFSGFAGYRTFENLVVVLNKIEESIGEIVDFYRKDYSDSSAFALLIRNNNRFFLVTLGSNTVSKDQIIRLQRRQKEEKLIDIILKKDISNKKPHQEYFAHREYICELKDGMNARIEDIIHLLACISFRIPLYDVGGEITLKTNSNIFYLANADDIKPCSIGILSNIEHTANNLYVSFYKVEPKGNGKIDIKSFRKQKQVDRCFDEKDKEVESLFEDGFEDDFLFWDDEDLEEDNS